MNSLFRRTFIAFVASLVVLCIVLAGALIAGYNRSMVTWSARRTEMVQEAAYRILSGAAEEPDAVTVLPPDVPVFIYDAEDRLVASNRGVGRRRELEHVQRLPVHANGTLLGTVSIGSTAFRNDAANSALVESLAGAAVAGVLAAVAAAILVAWLFARSLSGPAARVAEGIDRIAHGVRSSPIPEEGAAEVVRIAQAANTLSARLRGEQELRAQWARDVTHDLRTPIASMRSQLEAIVDGVHSAGPATVQSTLAELERVEHLIADLDELMRLEEPNVEVRVRQIPAEEFLATLHQRFSRDIEEKRIVFTRDVRIPAIAGDERLLNRAFSNLLNNAIRHAPAGARVVLRIEPASEQAVCLSVTNDGEPIPQEELPHVFDRLYRGEYARNSSGSGLGLTIAKRIVLLHEGEIDIQSSSERGTTVRIRLPRSPGGESVLSSEVGISEPAH